jgi:hypothetical protein
MMAAWAIRKVSEAGQAWKALAPSKASNPNGYRKVPGD